MLVRCEHVLALLHIIITTSQRLRGSSVQNAVLTAERQTETPDEVWVEHEIAFKGKWDQSIAYTFRDAKIEIYYCANAKKENGRKEHEFRVSYYTEELDLFSEPAFSFKKKNWYQQLDRHGSPAMAPVIRGMKQEVAKLCPRWQVDWWYDGLNYNEELEKLERIDAQNHYDLQHALSFSSRFPLAFVVDTKKTADQVVLLMTANVHSPAVHALTSYWNVQGKWLEIEQIEQTSFYCKASSMKKNQRSRVKQQSTLLFKSSVGNYDEWDLDQQAWRSEHLLPHTDLLANDGEALNHCE